MKTLRIAVSIALLASLAACSHAPATTAAGASSASRSTTNGWIMLERPEAWRGYESPTLPTGWTFENGVISKQRSVGDLMTKDQYANFELALDWKIGSGGNSGIFYHGTTEYDHIYWSGPEYQLLDDANAPDGKNPLTSAGSDYAVYAPPRGVVKAAGEWNTTRIVVNGAHVEHWLNGQKVVEYDLWSPDWTAKVAASKFHAYPNYGMAKRGYIGIQGDHPGSLAIRNIRIRVLP